MMTQVIEKTESQIELERKAVAAMVHAKSNMETAIKRIETLERALTNAKLELTNTKQFIGVESWTRGSNSTPARNVHSVIDEAVSRIATVLG